MTGTEVVADRRAAPEPGRCEPAPDAHAPDGSPVEVFALLPAGGVPDLITGALAPGAEILELGCGAGRMTHALLARGHRVVAVDQCPEMLARVRGAEAVLADIETLDLGRRFQAVVLASFLVNTPLDHQRDQFLATCARHVRPDGVVLIQRLDPELVPLAVDVESEEAGIVYSMADVAHDGDLFSATMGFTIGDRRWEHPYKARVLTDEVLEAALDRGGLKLDRWLDRRAEWARATLAAPSPAPAPRAPAGPVGTVGPVRPVGPVRTVGPVTAGGRP